MEPYRLIAASAFGAAGALLGFICHRVAKSRGRRLPVYVSVPAGLVLGALEGAVHGCTDVPFVSLFLLCILLLASVQDREEHRMEDAYWITVLALAAGRISASGPCGFLLGLGLGFLPFLPGLLTHSPHNAGGADVKLSASLGALLGGVTVLPGLLLSLTVAVCVRLLRRKQHPEEKGRPFALVPYLALGYGTVWVAARALETLAGLNL